MAKSRKGHQIGNFVPMSWGLFPLFDLWKQKVRKNCLPGSWGGHGSRSSCHITSWEIKWRSNLLSCCSLCMFVEVKFGKFKLSLVSGCLCLLLGGQLIHFWTWLNWVNLEPTFPVDHPWVLPTFRGSWVGHNGRVTCFFVQVRRAVFWGFGYIEVIGTEHLRLYGEDIRPYCFNSEIHRNPIKKSSLIITLEHVRWCKGSKESPPNW